MPPQERFKRRLVALDGEALQQFRITIVGRRTTSEAAQVSEERRSLSLGHANPPLDVFTLVVQADGGLLSLFCPRPDEPEAYATERPAKRRSHYPSLTLPAR